MTLDGMLKALAVGALSNLAVAKDGEIDDKYKSTVIQAINDSLTNLYTRFLLKTNEIYLQTVIGKIDYEISKEHVMKSHVPDWNHYLFPEYNDDLIKVERVQTTAGLQLPLNDVNCKYSVYTPAYNILRLPDEAHDVALVISYRANHPRVTEDLNQEIECPEFLLTAVYNYVAFVIHTNINSPDAVQNSQKYLTVYNQLLMDNLNAGTAYPVSKDNEDRFTKNKWV